MIGVSGRQKKAKSERKLQLPKARHYTLIIKHVQRTMSGRYCTRCAILFSYNDIIIMFIIPIILILLLQLYHMIIKMYIFITQISRFLSKTNDKLGVTTRPSGIGVSSKSIVSIHNIYIYV